MKKALKLQVAERIREILLKKGWKQQNLADEADMTKSYLSQIMHGTVNPTLETIEILEKALKEPILQITE